MNTRERIEQAFENRAALTPDRAPGDLLAAIDECLDLLGSGRARVAEPDGAGGWRVNEWLKKAVLLSFRLNDSVPMPGTGAPVYDKVPLKTEGWGANQFAAQLDEMSQAVLQNREPLTPGEEGLRDVRLIEAIYRSAKEGRTIRV